MTLDELLESSSVPKEIELTQVELAKLVRKHKGLLKQRERDHAFWSATNENLATSYEKLDEKEKELAKAYGIIQEDLSVATQIQQALLPIPSGRMQKDLDLAVYHKQLAEVGGDYYDFFRTKSGGYALGVFDISGHGVSAALVMTYLKAQFMMVMESLESPIEIVERINEVSLPFLRAVKKYATVSFVVFHEDSLRYVCGGGFGLLLSGEGEHVFEKGDSFLGLRNKPFHGHELPFKKGAILAVYTDGMVEAQNSEQEDYSVRRLNELIVKNAKKPAKTIVELCVEDYQKFRANDTDDITLMIMRKQT